MRRYYIHLELPKEPTVDKAPKQLRVVRADETAVDPYQRTNAVRKALRDAVDGFYPINKTDALVCTLKTPEDLMRVLNSTDAKVEALVCETTGNWRTYGCVKEAEWLKQSF